jgi:hypothetical protein
MTFLRWLMLNRKLELFVLAVGILLRLSMVWNYGADWSYDSRWHWEVVQWIIEHGKIPSPEATFEAFHPPLWYALAAWLVKHGATRAQLVYISILSGIVRLVVIGAILELFVPRSRLARVVALTLAATTCVSVHVDGMVYHESLAGLFGAIALLLLAVAARHANGWRWLLAIALGIDIGLAMLTKASGVVLLVSIGVVAAVELTLIDRPWRARVRNLQPWIAAAAIAVAMSGWYYAPNVREYGKPFVSSFDLPSQEGAVTESNKLPWEDRRTLGYLFGWDRGLYLWPYGIRYVGSHPRYFAVAVASTFVDFWLHSFHGYEKVPHPPGAGPGEQGPFIVAAIRSMIGGTIIFVATLVAWFAMTWRSIERRDLPILALMLAPLVGTAAMIHFSTTFPVDGLGIIKGAYLNFVAPPLYALFGMAVSWAKNSWHRFPIFVVLLVALSFTAAYTIECRLHLRILPQF